MKMVVIMNISFFNENLNEMVQIIKKNSRVKVFNNKIL